MKFVSTKQYTYDNVCLLDNFFYIGGIMFKFKEPAWSDDSPAEMSSYTALPSLITPDCVWIPLWILSCLPYSAFGKHIRWPETTLCAYRGIAGVTTLTTNNFSGTEASSVKILCCHAVFGQLFLRFSELNIEVLQTFDAFECSGNRLR